MKSLIQLYVLAKVSVTSLPRRWGTAAVTLVSIACVVSVFVGIFSMVAGFERTMLLAGSDRIAIVMRKGAQGELRSNLSAEQASIIADTAAPRASSAELFTSAEIDHRGQLLNLTLRGITGEALAVRENIAIVKGRMFNTGTRELLIGRSAAVEMGGLDVGSTLEIGQTQWRIVGVFADGGSASESELWLDVFLLREMYGQGYSSVRVVLEDGAGLQKLQGLLDGDRRLDVAVISEMEYYASQSEQITDFIRLIGYPLAFVMALGAVFSALNTMYTSLSARVIEISTLQAIGYRPALVCAAVLIESVALALLGGLAGTLAVFLAFDGRQGSTLDRTSLSQLNFDFTVTPELMLQGMSMALFVGLAGGLLLAVRVLRMPIAVSLRQR